MALCRGGQDARERPPGVRLLCKLPMQKKDILIIKTKKYPAARVGYFLVIKTWQCPTFAWGNPKLSSALNVFTSEFEMDLGGSRSLMSPGKTVT